MMASDFGKVVAVRSLCLAHANPAWGRLAAATSGSTGNSTVRACIGAAFVD